MNKSVLISLALLVFVGAVGVFWFSTRQAAKSAETASKVVPVEEKAVEPTEVVEATAPASLDEEEEVEIVTGDSVGEKIAGLLAEKFGKDKSQANVIVSDEREKHAKGGVSFTGEIGGAWWLAAFADGEWVLVADGNGVVICDLIEPYDFPTDMVPECFDEASGESITR